MKQKVCEMSASSQARRRLNCLDRRLSPFIPLKRLACVALLLMCSTAMAAETPSVADQPSIYRAIGLGLAAAFSVGVSILGAGYAVGRIGSAALGAISEKPELLPRAILFVALGEGLAVLGFAFAMLLLQKM